MSKSKVANNIIILFILIVAAIVLYRVIFLGKSLRRTASKEINGFVGCEKGFCS